ncbi:GTPase family protein [Neptunomonas phycophila]|uniref:GTPase family protein n=1 Tax=Neptunomonas phycophila TaxID=1572645 RepID=UPI0037360AFF
MSIVESFNEIEDKKKERTLNDIKKELKRVRNYTPKVGVFGDTGVGKSSLCNALFGREIAKISDVEACTREPQEILVGDKDGGGIILVDVPGVGEDPKRHREYMELYKSLLPELDLVIWAIKSDDRKYATAINVYNEVILPNIKTCPVIFTITQVDKIEPYRDWDLHNNRPGEKQKINLQAKINDVSSKFNVSTNKIVPVASDDAYNLVELVNKIVEILPNEKKFAFTREAKEENVSPEAARNAEKGIFDHVKELAGDVWDFVKEDVVETIVETAKEYVPKIAKKVFSWVRSWF